MSIDAKKLRRLHENRCHADVAALLALHVPEILAALEDRERLEWLECVSYTTYRHRDPETGGLYRHHTLVNEDTKPRMGIVKKTLRATIDAARRGGKE